MEIENKDNYLILASTRARIDEAADKGSFHPKNLPKIYEGNTNLSTWAMKSTFDVEACKFMCDYDEYESKSMLLRGTKFTTICEYAEGGFLLDSINTGLLLVTRNWKVIH